MAGILSKIRTTLEMIKWEHSIFALPFALTAMLLAAHGLPSWRTVLWIIVAMVSARSAAMAFNRWADADLDAKNPAPATGPFQPASCRGNLFLDSLAPRLRFSWSQRVSSTGSRWNSRR